MPDSSVAITPGSGVEVDTRTQSAGDHRQVVVLGDGDAATVATVTTGGGLRVEELTPSTATRSSVTAATVDTQLLAANTARRGFTVFNDGTATLYLACGTAAASTTDYTVQVSAGSYFESPWGYRGAVRGIWSAANGAARITEMT